MSQDQIPEVIDAQEHLIPLLMNWHENKVNVLKHLQGIPEGTEVLINDTETVLLSGDLMKGFHLGISVALIELGTLPLGYLPDEAEETLQ